MRLHRSILFLQSVQARAVADRDPRLSKLCVFFAQLDPKTEQLEFQEMHILRIDAADSIDAAVTPTFSSRFLPPMLPTQMMRMLLPPQIVMMRMQLLLLPPQIVGMRMPLLLQTQMMMMRMPLVIATN